MNRRKFSRVFIQCTAATQLSKKGLAIDKADQCLAPSLDFTWRNSTVLAQFGLFPDFLSLREFSAPREKLENNKRGPMLRLLIDNGRECAAYFLRIKREEKTKVFTGSYISIPVPPSLTHREAKNLAAAGIDFRKRIRPFINMFSDSSQECAQVFEPVTATNFAQLANLTAMDKPAANSPRNILEYSDEGENDFSIEWSPEANEVLDGFQKRFGNALQEAMARFG